MSDLKTALMQDMAGNWYRVPISAVMPARTDDTTVAPLMVQADLEHRREDTGGEIVSSGCDEAVKPEAGPMRDTESPSGVQALGSSGPSLRTRPKSSWELRAEAAEAALTAERQAREQAEQDRDRLREALSKFQDYADDLRSRTWLAPMSAAEMNYRDRWLADEFDKIVDAALSPGRPAMSETRLDTII